MCIRDRFRTYDEMVAEGLATKYEGNWVTTFCADHPIDQDTAPVSYTHLDVYKRQF